MLKEHKNLLPGMVFDRDALIQKLSKIKPRVPRRFTRLVIISFILFTLLGYYPVFDIPPIRKSFVGAAVLEQTGEVIAESFSQPIILPHPGYLTTRFSSYHPGVDIATGLGMPIHPITEGEVVKVARDFFGLGNFVTVSHQNGFKSTYAHMSRIYVKVGDKITSENTLGEVGLTGRTSGPHTHLEVTRNDKFIDPQTLLPEIPKMPASPASGVASPNRGEPVIAKR